MKWSITLLSFFLLISINALAEDHGGGQSVGRPTFSATQVNPQDRLFELMSACMAGRPFPPSRTVIPPVTIATPPPIAIADSGAAPVVPPSTSPVGDPTSGSGSGGSGSGTGTPPPTQPSPPTTPPGTPPPAGGSSAEAILTANCLSCHHHDGQTVDSFSGAKAGIAITKINSGEMPMGATLAPADKAALLDWLSKR